MKRLITILGFSVLTVALLSAFAVPGFAKDKTIKVGFPAPLSGSAAGWGESMLQGTLLGIEDINEAGGVHGYQLELIKGDVESQDEWGEKYG